MATAIPTCLPEHSAHLKTLTALPSDNPMPLLERRRIIGSQAMISHVTLQKGCHVPTHAHENEQFAYILQGRVRFTLGTDGSPGQSILIATQGQVLHLPSNIPHSAYAEEESIVLDIFSPPSATTGIDRKT